MGTSKHAWAGVFSSLSELRDIHHHSGLRRTLSNRLKPREPTAGKGVTSVAKVYIVIQQNESDDEWPYVWDTCIRGVYSAKTNAEICADRLRKNDELQSDRTLILEWEVE